MHWKSRVSELDHLKRCWCRWTAVVELFARRRPSRRRVSHREYKTIYQELLEACRTAAGSSTEEKQPYFGALESMVRPWMSPRVLAQADREILYDLLLRCQQVERELGHRRWSARLPSGLGRGLLLVLAAALVGAVVILAEELGAPVFRVLRDAFDLLWFSFRRSNDFQRLTLLAVLLILVSIFTVSRTARS